MAILLLILPIQEHGYLSSSLNHLQFPLLVFYNSQHISFSLLSQFYSQVFFDMILKETGCLHSLSESLLLV